MVLKPSETAPFSSQILAEIIHDAGVSPGVFNLVNGDGAGVGSALCRHPDVDMVSFTGSTRAGVEVAKAAATSVKRVAQELGGKSANIVLDDTVLDDTVLGASVAAGVRALMVNSGQSCNAPSRMLVPAARMDEAAAAARAAVDGIKVGDPSGNATMGPVANQVQWRKIQSMIQSGIDDGAVLVVGGLGRPDDLEAGSPDDLEAGSYVRPTVFAQVDNTMTIAREEIFGPVLCILGYDDLDHAVRLANDTPYGLAGYVSGQDLAQARTVAGQIRAGQVSINGANDLSAPFGGYKQSGNGREWGDHGFHDFLETKAILGYGA
jgi:aldehyde dehydrogenase (NAD+)